MLGGVYTPVMDKLLSGPFFSCAKKKANDALELSEKIESL